MIRVWVLARSKLDRKGRNVSPQKDHSARDGNGSSDFLSPATLLWVCTFTNVTALADGMILQDILERPRKRAVLSTLSLIYRKTHHCFLKGIIFRYTSRLHFTRCDVTMNDQKSIYGSKPDYDDSFVITWWYSCFVLHTKQHFLKSILIILRSKDNDCSTRLSIASSKVHYFWAIKNVKRKDGKYKQYYAGETVLHKLDLQQKQEKDGSSCDSTWRDTIEGSRSEFVSYTSDRWVNTPSTLVVIISH